MVKTTAIISLSALLVSGVLSENLNIAAGYAAKNLCSWIFVTGINEKKALNSYIYPVFKPFKWLMKSKVNYREKSVIISTRYNIKRKAIFRKNLGCTLLNKKSEAIVRSQKISPIPSPLIDPQKVWPQGSKVIPSKNIAPHSLKKIRTLLNQCIKNKKRNVLAMVVVYDNTILAEAYGTGISKKTKLLSWSMAKSVTNNAIGILVKQKKLTLSTKVSDLIQSPYHDDKRKITINHLLRMSSGLHFKEIYFGSNHVTRMLYLKDDMALYALSQKMKRRPGKIFKYSSGDSNILTKTIFLKNNSSVNDAYRFIQKELFHKINITSAIFEIDSSGSFIGSSYVYMTARDYARLGLFWLKKGKWKDKIILPEWWMDYSLKPTLSSHKRTYGAHFWLNSPGKPRYRKWKKLPTDMFLARGYQGQYIIVIPSYDLVVVRLGVTFTPGPVKREINHVISEIIKVLPKG